MDDDVIEFNKSFMIEKILIIAIIALYLKWICIVLLYPLEACWGVYQNHKPNKIFKLLAVPAYCVERFLRFGGVGS